MSSRSFTRRALPALVVSFSLLRIKMRRPTVELAGFGFATIANGGPVVWLSVAQQVGAANDFAAGTLCLPGCRGSQLPWVGPRPHQRHLAEVTIWSHGMGGALTSISIRSMIIRMRTTLDLPGPLLDEAQRLLGFKSKTDTVVLSLTELVRRRRVDELKSLAGHVDLRIDLDRARRRPDRSSPGIAKKERRTPRRSPSQAKP